MNAKRTYRLYAEEGLIVRTICRKERAQRQRVEQGSAIRPNQKWSMDFVVQSLVDGRWVRVLTVVDEFTRECLVLFADVSLTGEKVAAELDKIVADRGAPQSITVDNGTEFASKAVDVWAYHYAVHLDVIRPGRPVDVEVFFSLADARHKLAVWFEDYNHRRPHSSLADRTPAEFAKLLSGGKDGDTAALENAPRFPLPHRTAAARNISQTDPSSTQLLEIIT